MRNKKYFVNKLYIGFLGIYTKNCYIYDESPRREEIVVVRKYQKHYINVLNSRKYRNINEVLCKNDFYGQMVIYKLLPLEQGFKTTLDETINEKDLKEAYNDWNEKEEIKPEETKEEIKDPVLTQILIVSERVKNSNINELEKETFKRKLIEIGEYYVSELENSRKNDNIILDNNISELKLIRSCMEKLSEIEMMIPGRNKIGEIQKQLKLFKEKIK